MEGTILETGGRMTLDLKQGVENNIRNPNPMNWEVEIETTGGSLIAFTVPAGGSFTLKPVEGFGRVTINCGEVVGYGPRPVHDD